MTLSRTGKIVAGASAVLVALLTAAVANAQVAQTKIDTGDTAWMLTSSALVLLMTVPGLALFYGGMVRRKNVLSTLMHSFVLAALVSVQWVVYGYSLAFSPDVAHGLIGGLSWLGLNGVSAQAGSQYAPTIPHQAYMVYQCTGLFASALINPAGADGLFFGHPAQLLIQSVAVVATSTFAFAGSVVLFKLVDLVVGLRATGEGERMGLDLSEHDETAYALEV